MAGNGGARPGAGRKSNAVKMLEAGFAAPFFGPDVQERQWRKFLNSEDEKIALDATKYLTDRVYGKAKQAVEVTGEDGGPIHTAISVTFVKTSGQPPSNG